MEIVEVSDDESDGAPAPEARQASCPPESPQPPAGFRRTKIVEVSDDESDDEGNTSSLKDVEAPEDVFPHIKIVCDKEGLENAKMKQTLFSHKAKWRNPSSGSLRPCGSLNQKK